MTKPSQNVTLHAETQQGDVAMRAGMAATPMELLQTAVQCGADVDKLERLMVLQERWETNAARKPELRYRGCNS